ncbi:MAG: metallopeptidase TldD-related protein [Thermotogota bacterium]
MNKEIFQINKEEFSIKLTNSKIASLRKKDIQKNAFRVYKDGFIGISGSLGEIDEEELEKKALKALENKIPYSYDITKNQYKTSSIGKDLMSDEEFLQKTEDLLERLNKKHPDFTFSNSIIKTRSVKFLRNDENTELVSELNHYDSGIIFKHKNSKNIMDGFFGDNDITYNVDKIEKFADLMLDNYNNELDFEDGEYPVVFFSDDMGIQMKFIRDLHGMVFGSGSSLFSDKIGEKLFSEDFSLLQTANYEKYDVIKHFFDNEGTYQEGFTVPLIENGVLKRAYTDKKTSKIFDLDLTGSADGGYDSVPNLNYETFVIEPSKKTAKELLGNKKAVIVIEAGGGDFTADGKYASPVQLSYLYENGEIKGRLPQLNVNSHIYDMFGKDFVGVPKDSVLGIRNKDGLIMNMKVSKI